MEHQSKGSGSRSKETLVDTVKTKKRRTTVERTKPTTAANEPSKTSGSNNSRSREKHPEELSRPPPVIATETDAIYEPDSVVFRVRWKGYSEADDTFEPLENLDGCLQLVRKYLIKRKYSITRRKGAAGKESDILLIETLLEKVHQLMGTEAESLGPESSSSAIPSTASSLAQGSEHADTLIPPSSTPPLSTSRSQRAISISSTESSETHASISSLSTMSRRTTPPKGSPHLQPQPSSQLTNGSQSSPAPGVSHADITHVGAEPEPESEIDENDPDKDFKHQLAAFRRIFSGLPWPPITVETPPRDAVFQTEFKFIDRPVLHDAVVSQKDKAEFMLRCHCGPGGCKIEPDGSSNCECVIEAKNIGHGIPFDPDGRISVNLKSTAVWVCNHLCSCGPECLTKASSLGRPAKLKIKWTGAKGWGVFLDQDEPIPPRTFISRYVGEIITTEEAERRGREYDRRGTTYLFDMDCNSENEALFTIDAQRMGNESHFFNHSCRPNLQVYNLFGEYANVYLMTPSFWTIRTIRKGDELTFDYNGHYQASWLRNSDDRTSESEDEEENDRLLFHANGNHNQPTQKQQQAPHSKGKRRRQVDSEDDYYDDLSSTSSGGHMSANGDSQQANITAAASSPRPIQRPSSPTHKGTRNPVDRTRAARKRSSGAHLSAATPAIVARLPAKYATGSSSGGGGGGGRRQPSVDGSTLRIPCHCGEKNCRKFVHMPRVID
ncbi:hypothetical protein BGW42_005841 [Actinomortierella wolfii]|nr:hypothetical protein BGW42_005841 [Actinomortierella wolfii]